MRILLHLSTEHCRTHVFEITSVASWAVTNYQMVEKGFFIFVGTMIMIFILFIYVYLMENRKEIIIIHIYVCIASMYGNKYKKFGF